MRRYPSLDPPEYVRWRADPELVQSYVRLTRQDGERARLIDELDQDRRLSLYRDLLRTRLHDLQLKRWVHGGVISKAWLGTGEEAVTVGSVAALDATRDLVYPMIRNAGALHMMGVPLVDMFRGYLGDARSPNGGRDLHLGDLSRGVLAPVSQMGTNVPVAAGAALAFRNTGQPRVALTWIGDGATRTGAAHEGINFAALLRLPVVFVVQSNQVALGTTTGRHSAGALLGWSSGYGAPVWVCDGNNVLDVYAATGLAVRLCRGGEGPALVLAETFRMGGHATHDEREARELFAGEVFEQWGRRDPIGSFEAYLTQQGFASPLLEAVEAEVFREVDAAAQEARSSRLSPEPESALYEGFSEGGALVGIERRPV